MCRPKRPQEDFLNRFWVLGIVIAFLFLGGFLPANGVQENRVARARELIAEKNYNEAILILTTVVREEPDRQDEAQELISLIVRLRNQYNNDYEELIRLLYTEKDEAKALLVIAQLEALDRNPNKQTADDIKQAKRSARLIANNKRYRDILARALAFLNRREYGAAVQVYLEGSDLAKDMFLESGLGNVLTNQVERTWDDLKAASNQFIQAEVRLKTLMTQGTALLAADGTTDAAFEGLLSAMRDLAGWRQRAWADGRSFRNQNDFLVKNDRQEDFFLGYSALLVHGPGTDSQVPQGILGAMDRLWEEILTPWTQQLRSGVEAAYSQAMSALDREAYAPAAQAFAQLRSRARRGLDVMTLWNRWAGIAETGALDSDYRVRLAQVLPLGLWLEHRLSLAVQGFQLAQELPQTKALAALTTMDREALNQARIEAGRQKQAYGEFALRTGQWTAQALALGPAGFTLLDGTAFSASWQAIWTGYRQESLALEAGFVDRRGSLDFTDLDSRFQTLQTTLTAARDQVEGRIKYPLQASVQLESLRPPQEGLVRDLTAFIAGYEAEPEEIKTPAVARWPVRGRDLLARLTAAQTLRGQLAAAAQANYAQSQTAKRQGQELVPQIRTAVAAENFTVARNALNQVSTRYSQSLALQEDPDFRAESDAQVKDLFDLILKGENEVVVREVRRLITQGSQSYLSQQFPQAEQILLRARTRWATTNTDPNAEVEYWLTLTTYALSVTTGRELSPIDPLYNEVQQLLNFARRNYTLGLEKITAGDREGGLALMQEAKGILTKILVPFPLNQEARLLNLEILKASDPDNFPGLFKQNFDAAVANINGDATLAYNDLQDLDKIQPNYPGMAAAIAQVRRKLNLDRQAVDPRVAAQARVLVAQASRIFEAGNPAQWPNAQAQVRQALALDPTNGDAQALFDRISLRLSGTVVTLTPTQVGELNAILDLLRAQRTLEALSQLTEFKAKYPGVGNEARVKEAERRIKAVN